MKHKILKESTMTEAPGDDRTIDATLPPEYLYDPKPFKIKDILSRRAREKDEAEAAAAIEKEKEDFRKAATKKYGKALEDFKAAVNSDRKPSDVLDSIFDSVVPASGAAETVGGEIVRAMMRILYRNFNDGDVFYDGYGLETVASSMAYLINQDAVSIDEAANIAEAGLTGSKYTDALENITDKVNHYLAGHTELFATKNTVDSRTYDASVIEEMQPESDIYLDYSEDVRTLLDAGVISYRDIEGFYYDYIRDLSRHAGGKFKSPKLNADSYGLTISEISSEVADTLGVERDFWGSLEDEYRDYIDRINDEYDDDEIDESLIEAGGNTYEVQRSLSSRLDESCECDDEYDDDDVDFSLSESDIKKISEFAECAEEPKQEAVAPVKECNEISCEEDDTFAPDDSL